jgi:hypothetical protein
VTPVLLLYDEMTKRRNAAGQIYTGPDSHRHLTQDATYHALRFGCRILIPPDTSVYTRLGGKKNLRLGLSSGAVLNQLLASSTCQLRLLPTFLSLSTIPPLSTLRAALRAKPPYCEFHAQFRNNIMLPKRFTQAGISEQHYTDLESRYPKNMP